MMIYGNGVDDFSCAQQLVPAKPTGSSSPAHLLQH